MTLAVAVGQQRRARLALHVDEAGRHGQAPGIDDAARLLGGEIPDRHDAIADHAHIGAPRRLAGAVDHVAAAHDQIEATRALFAART